MKERKVSERKGTKGEGEVREKLLTGMSPLSSRLSSPLRASSCDIGGGVSYSQRGEEEERRRRIVQPWPPQPVSWLNTSMKQECVYYLGISAVGFW